MKIIILTSGYLFTSGHYFTNITPNKSYSIIDKYHSAVAINDIIDKVIWITHTV